MAYQIISILHFTGYIALDFPRDIHIYWVDTFEKQFKKYVKVAPLRLVQCLLKIFKSLICIVSAVFRSLILLHSNSSNFW